MKDKMRSYKMFFKYIWLRLVHPDFIVCYRYRREVNYYDFRRFFIDRYPVHVVFWDINRIVID